MESGAWWRGASLYQIYPRSFADSDGDGVGDLKGIAERLDHVAALGVDGIWISPFFPSPMRDFGYDVTDHCGVDPLFGTLADFDALLARAHSLGLRVVIDQVWSHTASDHPWFLESRSDRANAKSDWYVWADAKADGTPPNNWLSWMGGSAWTWEPRRAQYYLHNFLPQMPDLNFHNAAVREAVLAVGRFWLDRGVDGFRLDTANFYSHDPDLTDNPPKPSGADAPPVFRQRHVHNICRPENLGVLSDVRGLLDSYGDRMAVAEIGSEDNLARMIEYTSGPDRLHTAYSFLLLGDRPTARAVADMMRPWTEGPGRDAWPSWALSNHDAVRVATRWGGGRADARMAQVFLALLATLRGTIFVYQGEELGLPQAVIPPEAIRDPYGLAHWPYSAGRDGCRTPMPWDAAPAGVGFSTGSPWLPVPDTHRPLAVAAQEDDPTSTLSAARRLLAFRKERPSLRLGDWTTLEADDDLLVVLRRHGDDAVLSAINLGPTDRTAPLPGGLRPSGASVAVGGAACGHRLDLPAHSAVLLAVESALEST